MLNSTLKHVATQSMLYGIVLSQPFAVNADFYPALQNKLLLEAKLLQYGEHGELVRILQKKLNKLDYYTDAIDGELGIFTEHALKKIQKDLGISIHGQADMETIYAIIKAERERYLKQIESLSESIYPGMHGEDVKFVQEALHYFGYYDGKMDGIYGPLTKKALEIAEENHDIELVHEITPTALKTIYEQEEEEENPENTNTQSTQIQKNTVKRNEQEKEEAADEPDVEEIQRVEVQAVNSSGIIEVAKSHIGTPYVWGGVSPGGFDCSGFIHFVYESQGITVPRTVSEIWNFAQPVDAPSVGDLVFFQTYKPGPSHTGIYLGNGQFIHAGEQGVEISGLGESYWEERYIGAKRVNN